MDTLLTPTELAEYLHRPEKTLAMWRYRSIGPSYIKVANGHVRYRQSDVEHWLAANTITAGDAA